MKEFQPILYHAFRMTPGNEVLQIFLGRVGDDGELETLCCTSIPLKSLKEALDKIP